MRNFIYIVAIFISLIVSSSCSKSDESTTFMNATVNDEVLELAISQAKISKIATGTDTDSIVSLIISGAKTDFSKAFIFNLELTSTDTGKFYFNEQTNKIKLLQASYAEDTLTFYSLKSVAVAQHSYLSITAISKSNVKGTFAFMAACDTKPDSIIIVSRGSFSAPIK